MQSTANMFIEKLGKFTELKMREHGLDALRLCTKKHFDMGCSIPTNRISWINGLIQLVCPGASLQVQRDTDKERFYLDGQQVTIPPFDPDTNNGTIPAYYNHIFRFWQWMEHAGYAYSVNPPNGWAITALGIRHLKSEHPCRPGAMERLRIEFGTIHCYSLDRLEDAIDCYERDLMRPAVILLGLAFEELITNLLRIFDPDAETYGAAVRQDRIKNRIEDDKSDSKGDKDKKEAIRGALAAINVADDIRTARNKASHEAAGVWDPLVVDDFLADGFRAYPKLARYPF